MKLNVAVRYDKTIWQKGMEGEEMKRDRCYDITKVELR